MSRRASQQAKRKENWLWNLVLSANGTNGRFIHASGIYFFTKGFLLTRLVLDEKSTCASPPIGLSTDFKRAGTPDAGCWHPKTFDKAVVVIIDALRYDFTVPFNTTSGESHLACHDALPFLYETAVKEPKNAFLLPFIADPPTTTLQRLKGLTTGTLPTFVDAGSNFAGTAIEEDNLLMQLKDAGKKIVHLGDDTWTALFPGYFEPDISRAYDSLNAFDLHTLDDGVNEHIMPLLAPKMKGKWDVMIAHYLGVDHAGHRYGPNHFAMTAKLKQMDGVLRGIAEKLDDDTLMVVMGDHGMDPKGDHGGESDDEVQAALWMYSKKGIFGRTDPSYAIPPPNAKVRPVDQIDLVPTLALLLGLPIPFNNIGKPIEEAFAGKKGNSWENLAGAVRMAAAGTQRYQAAYYVARGINESTISTSEGTPHALWAKADLSLSSGNGKVQMWKDVYYHFSNFQIETLRIFRDLWARFDVPQMLTGIAILFGGVLSLILFAVQNMDEPIVVENAEAEERLERIERQAEVDDIARGKFPTEDDETTGRPIMKSALVGTTVGAMCGLGATTILATISGEGAVLDFNAALQGGAGLGVVAVLYAQTQDTISITDLLPTNIWSWLALVFTVSQSVGFASNSFTIWEDSQLLFFITTFGIFAVIKSARIDKRSDRTLGIYHSIAFVVLGWIASFSKLCREEQMPFCKSTYYASANSSTSAPWQLLIPFLIAMGLPSIIKSYYLGSRSYEGFAPLWIGWVFRIGLTLSALFWTLDAADDGEWLTSYLSPTLLKTLRVPVAQTILAMSLIAGSTAFVYAPPCISLTETATSTYDSNANAQIVDSKGKTVTILGYANTHGTRYFLLVINILLSVILVQKPMGAGAIALCAWQILSLAEILDLNTLTTSPIGPVILALLGSFHFFKTGHSATLSSIQWETAFIPLHTIRYPWSPLLIALNSFGAQILCTVSVPILVFWKQSPRKKGLLRSAAVALAWHLAYYAVIGLATTMWAGHLRRHLMLYRIFSPKFMLSGVVLLIVDVVGVFIALFGVRFNVISVCEAFGWG